MFEERPRWKRSSDEFYRPRLWNSATSKYLSKFSTFGSPVISRVPLISVVQEAVDCSFGTPQDKKKPTSRASFAKRVEIARLDTRDLIREMTETVSSRCYLCRTIHSIVPKGRIVLVEILRSNICETGVYRNESLSSISTRASCDKHFATIILRDKTFLTVSAGKSDS